MVPESVGNRSVEMYVSDDFPLTWRREHTLIRDLALADPTLQQIAGRWWLFATAGPTIVEQCSRLVIFHADSVTGPWSPHRFNPVKINRAHARPAGRLFEVGGFWYRPAQDCSKVYGGGIIINRVELVTEDAYVETPVARLSPPSAAKATHTLNHNACWCVADVVVDRRPPSMRQAISPR